MRHDALRCLQACLCLLTTSGMHGNNTYSCEHVPAAPCRMGDWPAACMFSILQLKLAGCCLHRGRGVCNNAGFLNQERTFLANSALSWYSCARSSLSAGGSPDSRSALFTAMSGFALSPCDSV